MPAPAPDNPPLPHVSDLAMAFTTSDGPIHALRDVSHSALPDEAFGIVRASRSGKGASALAILGQCAATRRYWDSSVAPNLRALEARSIACTE
jgi:ABC-type dipeptide/oligopeptide/nickel transport system ATPase component